jgi:hypothetical protein
MDFMVKALRYNSNQKTYFNFLILGNQCEYISATCDTKPCQNNGVCVTNGIGFFCNCSSAYTGNYCETPKPNLTCDDSPCLNGGKISLLLS